MEPAVALLLLLLLPLAPLYYLHWQSLRPCTPEAEERATVLLEQLLSTEEQQQLSRDGYLAVRSPGVASLEYRIPRQGGLVGGYYLGELAMQICLQPTRRLPSGDVLLMHKLMIESDEREYLNQANIRLEDSPEVAWERIVADLNAGIG